FYPTPFLSMAWTLAGLGSVLWAIQVAIYFKSKLRRERDPGLFLAGGATVLLVIAWITFSLFNTPLPFIGLLVVGWLTLFTLGIYHRVVPFLVWYGRFTRGVGRGPVPKVKDLLSTSLGFGSAVTVLTGALIWGIGLAISAQILTYTGSCLLLIGTLISSGQIH